MTYTRLILNLGLLALLSETVAADPLLRGAFVKLDEALDFVGTNSEI